MTTTQIACLTWLLARANGSTEAAPAEVTTRTFSSLLRPRDYSAPAIQYAPRGAAIRYELTDAGRKRAEYYVANPPVAKKQAARGECQVCERQQALTKHGSMVHHGYQRPGWGCIVGDCMGVHHKPFPATDALERYLPVVVKHAEHAEQQAQEPSGYRFMSGYSEPDQYRRRKDIYTTVRNRAEYDAAQATARAAADASYRSWYSEYDQDARWERLVATTKANWASEAQHARREQQRVEERIAKGRAARGEN